MAVASNASVVQVGVEPQTTAMFDIVTSVMFASAAGFLIFILAVILLILGLYWYYYVRGAAYAPKTVHYTTQSDDEEVVTKKRGDSIAQASKGLGHPAVHHYPSHLSPVPVSPHIDIAAGHLLLTYIEDNLKSGNKLQEEWKLLQEYTPEDVSTTAATLPESKLKNRYPDALPYDHTRVKLSVPDNETGTDYINASFIRDGDPTRPRYIVTQGPLVNTVSDFWQMVWEQDVSVIVMLTTLSEMGMAQCSQYWPSSGVSQYHIYEVRLVSEHEASDAYVIRSLFLRNMQTQQSRTVTHFQYHAWPSSQVPQPALSLLEFRRKVNKAHAQQQSPLLIHCNGGIGRSGAYCLIDMALNRIASGAKEINLAATVEYLRDQRPNMVRTKAQFEFALAALIQETHAMLDAARQRAASF
ncbi:hypothetical protein EMCRGX_G022265 [Ephydatia muelleri]